VTGSGRARLVIRAPFTAAEVDAVAARVGSLLDGGVEVVECDVGALIGSDLGTLDALARLQLAADGRVRLRRLGRTLRDLLDLVGLLEVFIDSAGESGREAEPGEDRLGVEEEREFDDLPG
jgi:hypothetical protein